MCKNSLLSSDSLPLQRLFISGLHSKGRHNMDKILIWKVWTVVWKIRKPCRGFLIWRVLYVSV